MSQCPSIQRPQPRDKALHHTQNNIDLHAVVILHRFRVFVVQKVRIIGNVSLVVLVGHATLQTEN